VLDVGERGELAVRGPQVRGDDWLLTGDLAVMDDDGWFTFVERTADVVTRGLSKVVPADIEHVFYQYCVYTSDPALLSRRAIRRGIDIETTHVDVCSKLDLFKEFRGECPGAEATEKALQLPVYSRLRASDIDRVLRVVRKATGDPRTQEKISPAKAQRRKESPLETR